MKKYIYVLAEYANEKHLVNHTDKTTDEMRIVYEQNGVQIGLIETNSLVEDEYCLNLKSAKYTLEGTEVKESMIHHHKKGHSSRHLNNYNTTQTKGENTW
jgi:hypothetical protein